MPERNSNPPAHLTRSELILMLFFLLLLVFPVQYISRSLDMSTLTSWRWVFAGAGPVKIFLLILFGVAAVLPLSSLETVRRHPAALLFFLSLLCSLSFLNSPEVLLDSSRYFLQAKYIAQNGFMFFFRQWGGEINQWTDMPLVPLLYGTLFKLLAEKKIIVEVFNSLLFSFTPVLTYLSARRLWDSDTGFIAGLLVLASPYLFTQVPLMLVDIHTMFFLSLAVCTFLYSITGRGPLWTTLSAVTITLALLSKYSTWPMLSVLVIIAVAGMENKPLAVLKHCLGVAAVTLFLAGMVYFWKGTVIIEQIQFLRTYQLDGLKQWQEGYSSALFFQTHPLLALAVLLGFFRAIVHKDKKFLIIAWLGILVIILELKRVRYLLPLLPFYAMAGAYGLQIIKQNQVRRFFAYGCIVSSLAVAFWVFRPFLNSTSMSNLKDAGEYLDTLAGDTVRVVSLPQKHSLGNTAAAIPILDLYTGKKLYLDQTWQSEQGLKRAASASLRFTWELTAPSYYTGKKYTGNDLPLVIIASEPILQPPPVAAAEDHRYKLLKMFSKTTGIYRYQTHVTVFAPL